MTLLTDLEELDLAAERERKRAIVAYGELLGRAGKPRKGDGEQLRQLMQLLGIDRAQVEADVAARIRFAQREGVVRSAEKAAAERAPVVAELEAIAEEFRQIRERFAEREQPVIARLTAIDRAVGARDAAVQDMERLRTERPTAFGLTDADLPRAPTGRKPCANIPLFTAACSLAADIRDGGVDESLLDDDARTVLAQARSEGWVTFLGPQPPVSPEREKYWKSKGWIKPKSLHRLHAEQAVLSSGDFSDGDFEERVKTKMAEADAALHAPPPQRRELTAQEKFLGTNHYG